MSEDRLRVGFVSLGCSKNLVDTEVMLGDLERAGCTLVRDPAEADVVVVNTCSFIEPAREESIRTILETAAWKETGRLKKLVVAGCLVQRYPDELRRELPEVDDFVGLDEIERLPERLGLRPAPLRSDLPLHPSSGGPRPATYLYDDRSPRRLAGPAWTAYLKIAEGCDHTCSFCAIPSFRGAFRSRRPESVEAEARRLAAGGVREINLIAQDSSHYGRDLGLPDGLAGLLSRLDAVPHLAWVRVHYLYPNTVTAALIEAMASLPRVAKYVDIPLQHADPDVLRRMRRGGSAASHLELLDRFRGAMPDAALRTTLIVGFPGETEAEFETLVDFVLRARFDHLGVFSYSHEESTPAWPLADDVPAEVKEERRRRILEVQQEIAFERLGRFVGRTIDVLVEGAHPETEHLLVGRSEFQSPDVDGQVLLNDGHAEPGTVARVEVTETAGYDLVGRILDAP